MFSGSEWRTKETWLVSDDGLWDIGVGLSLLGFGLTMSLGHAFWFVGFVMLAYFLVVMAGKEVITRPRMIYFDLGDAQVKNLAKVIRIGLVVIIPCLGTSAIIFMVFDVGANLSWLSDYGPIILGGILSIILILFGCLTAGGSRYYVFSGWLFSAFLICQIFNLPVLPFVFSAVVLLTISGMWLLVRFVVNYPKTDTRENIKL